MLEFNIEKDSALLLKDRIDRRYFSGIDIAEGYLIYSSESAYFSDNRYYLDLKRRLSNSPIKAELFSGLQDVEKFIKEKGIKRIYINFSKETVEDYNAYKNWGIEILDGREIINSLRTTKSEKEIEYIEKACKIAQKAYYNAIKKVKEGMSEIELKEIIEENLKKQNSTSAFDIIVAFGKGSAVPHHETGKTKLKKNQVILVDMGATYKGYLSDITRTAFFGKPSKEFIFAYDKVLRANLLAEEEIEDGFTCCEADAVARNYLKEHNLDKYFTHSLGHGVGLEIHENVVLSPRSEEKLRENAVFTIEPGVYFENKLGIRIEDTVCIKNGKVKRLFTDDKKLLIIKTN
ncbi:MAG: M24 family metallopeptidase [Clostridia bacterium]|nr:M24 family metallopeptidase [Clostridia bacterium]